MAIEKTCVALRLPTELVKQIDTYAVSLGMNRTAAIIYLCNKSLHLEAQLFSPTRSGQEDLERKKGKKK